MSFTLRKERFFIGMTTGQRPELEMCVSRTNLGCFVIHDQSTRNIVSISLKLSRSLSVITVGFSGCCTQTRNTAGMIAAGMEDIYSAWRTESSNPNKHKPERVFSPVPLYSVPFILQYLPAHSVPFQSVSAAPLLSAPATPAGSAADCSLSGRRSDPHW